jgi:molybdopterin converting factor small subunit
MIEVRLCGILREIVPNSSASEDAILQIEASENEEFNQFIRRLDLESTDIGDCFINGNLAKESDILKDGDRIGLFPYNMRLIDGGMELKYSPHKR